MTAAKLMKNKWTWAAIAGVGLLFLAKKASAAPKKRIPIEYPFTSYRGYNALYDAETSALKACVDDGEWQVPMSYCGWAPPVWPF